MDTRTTFWSCIAASALLACSEAPQRPAPPARAAVLASFVAEVDAAAGTLTILPDLPASPAAALVELPAVQDGQPGTGPADTVELVTEGAGAVADGCAPGLSSFDGVVRVRSFFATSQLRDVHVELTGLTATGFEACDSAFPSPDAAVRRDVGLFPYGTLTRAGTAGDSALATWKFRYPSETSFTFWGRVVGEVVPAVPPAVTSSAPANGSTSSAGQVTVTFNEPMEPAATAAAISLAGPAGAVLGSVTASPGNQVFAFTPAAPLSPDTAYTLTVGAGAADPLGATLAAPYTAAFTTGPLQLSGTGSGLLQPLAAAYDRDGNGLLVWGATQAAPLYYAYYSAATGAWGAPALLDAGGYGARVAASTTQLAVLWKSSAGLNVAIFTNGIPGARTVLQASLLGYDQAIASNGSGFAAFWAGTGGTSAAIWDGVGWTSAYVAPDTYASGISVASDGARYRAVWIAGAGSSCAARSATYSGGAWSTVTLGSSSTGISPALAVTPTTTCIAWRGYGDLGATLRVERSGTVTTTTGFYGAYSWSSLAAAAAGDRCQVAAAGTDGVYGASHDGTSWTTTGASLGFATGADSPAVLPLGTTGFLVVARAGSHVQVNRAAAPGWAFAASAIQADTGAEAARSVIAARAGDTARLVFAKADAEGERLRIVRVDAVGVGAPETLPMPPPPGQAANVQLAANASGEVVAVWEQQDAGGTGAFCAFRIAGRWSAPQRLDARGTTPVVASNGTEFMVAWVTPGPSDVPRIVARRLAEGTWLEDATVVVAPTFWPFGPPLLASDGAGYALTYDGGFGPVGVIYSVGTWLAPQQLNTVGTKGTAGRANVAGRSGEYLFAWADAAVAYFRRAAWNGSTWAWGPATAMGGAYVPPALAAGPNGFATVYVSSTTGSPIEALLVTGGLASAATTLRTDASSCSCAVASNGTTYLAASGCPGRNVESRVWDGTQWQPARTMRANAYVLALSAASDGAGYAVIADGSPSIGGLWAITAPEPTAGGFGTVTLGTGSGDGEHGALTGTAGGFVAAWKQVDPAAAVTRIYARDL